MAENREDTSREDLTEEASPHRLEEYRNKGIVAQSKELTGLAVLLAVGIAVYTLSPQFAYQLGEWMREAFKADQVAKADFLSPETLHKTFKKMIEIIASIGLPVCGVGFVVGALGSFLQIGPILTSEPLTPQFERIDPLKGIQRLFSSKQLLEAAKLIIKLILIFSVAWVVLKEQVLKTPAYLNSDPLQLLIFIGIITKSVSYSFLGILVLFALIDFGFQKYEYGKNLRMTKQEAKQEHREREGDPQIRARIRIVQREMARKRMMQAVKKADVIVTNPTHIAIAIVYDKASMSAPRVVAKGADLMAERIKEIAAEAGIPRVENVPLARALFKSVKVGQSVPRNLYQAVAEVLAYVYRLRKRNL